MHYGAVVTEGSFDKAMRLGVERLRFLGSGLVRPECVVTHASGLILAADWQGDGGVTLIRPDGRVARITAQGREGDPLRPNGIALEEGGSILVAHLGAETGGLYRLFPDGALEPILLHLEGQPLPPSNFPLIDRKGRIWLTISTRVTPRALDYRPDAASGFIVLIDRGRARIAADHLGYTNECVFSADETHLFVNETFARRITRFRVASDGALSERTTFAEFGAGTFPDGIVRDSQDHFWITSIVSNRVIRVAPDGRQSLLFEESDEAHLAEVEAAFQGACMGRPHLDGSPATALRNASSLAFGGPDLRLATIGCLLGDRLAQFESAVPGIPHTTYAADLGPLSSLG